MFVFNQDSAHRISQLDDFKWMESLERLRKVTPRTEIDPSCNCVKKTKPVELQPSDFESVVKHPKFDDEIRKFKSTVNADIVIVTLGGVQRVI